jgi:NADH-quinone oxidoreductase subunit N
MTLTLNTTLILPEIIVLTMACIILVLDAYLPKSLKDLTYQLTQGTLIATAVFIFATNPDKSELAMNGMFVNDMMSAILKIFILVIVFLAFLYSKQYLQDRKLLKGEYLVLGLCATLGMMIMVSANTLLIIYLGLELLSLSLYTMVAMNRDSQQASEAAMKYFVLGALASGMLLYGMSIIYGVTGSLDLNAIAQAISQAEEPKTMLVFGLVFIVIGLAFKLGAVPFHVWIPDVYQGAPTAVTLFIASAPKIAAFAMLIRLLADGMQTLHSDWQSILILLSILSMAIGNIIAIAQTNIKRMLAYSTIAHVGYLLLGILTGTKEGYAASMFYVLVYTLMTVGGFGMILLLSKAGFEAEKLEDFKGLNQRSPWYAAVMLILMLSMAGIPPMVGFWAKWAVLAEVVQSGLVWLAIVAVIFAIIGVFYYLRVIKLMYFEDAEDLTPITANTDMHIAISANAIVILLLGMMPYGLISLCLGALGVN